MLRYRVHISQQQSDNRWFIFYARVSQFHDKQSRAIRQTNRLVHVARMMFLQLSTDRPRVLYKCV